MRACSYLCQKFACIGARQLTIRVSMHNYVNGACTYIAICYSIFLKGMSHLNLPPPLVGDIFRGEVEPLICGEASLVNPHFIHRWNLACLRMAACYMGNVASSISLVMHSARLRPGLSARTQRRLLGLWITLHDAGIMLASSPGSD